jgi:hypothetical protein
MMLLITDGLPRGLGELCVDDRPAGGTLIEIPTYTCTHCNRVVAMNPERKRERYKCRGCNHHICDECAAKRMAGEPCKTMQQKVDEYLESVERQIASGSPLVMP